MKMDIQYIKENQKFPFSFEYFENWLTFIFPAFAFATSISTVIVYFIGNKPKSASILIMSLVFGLLGMFLLKISIVQMNQNLEFTKIITGFDFSTNVELITSVFNKLYKKELINTSRIEEGLITADNLKLSLLFNRTYTTAICDDNVILLNSRSTVNKLSTVYENFENKDNIIENLKLEIKEYAAKMKDSQ